MSAQTDVARRVLLCATTGLLNSLDKVCPKTCRTGLSDELVYAVLVFDEIILDVICCYKVLAIKQGLIGLDGPFGLWCYLMEGSAHQSLQGSGMQASVKKLWIFGWRG